MKRIFLSLVLLGLSSVGALAACGGTTAQITDAAAATRQMALVNDPTGTNCAGVTASDIKYLNGTALASPSSYGTAPTGNVIGVNAYVTNTQTAVGNNADGVAAGAGAASPVVAYNYVYNGTTWDRQKPSSAVLNPCETIAQSYTPISITTATTTRIVTPSASNKTYICGLIAVTGAANNVAIVEGTGGTCGTATAGVIGGTTATNGANFAANGGIALQAGKTAHAQTAGTNVDLCLITSAATPLAGGIKYVQAP